jgi:hypothetical protein
MAKTFECELEDDPIFLGVNQLSVVEISPQTINNMISHEFVPEEHDNSKNHKRYKEQPWISAPHWQHCDNKENNEPGEDSSKRQAKYQIQPILSFGPFRVFVRLVASSI